VATISRLLKIQVSFAKKPYRRDCILQKRPMILRGLLLAANPPHTNYLFDILVSFMCVVTGLIHKW